MNTVKITPCLLQNTSTEIGIYPIGSDSIRKASDGLSHS